MTLREINNHPIDFPNKKNILNYLIIIINIQVLT
jgi:hypothetical protein